MLLPLICNGCRMVTSQEEPGGTQTMSTFAPIAPTIHVPPTKIAADTYVIHQVQEALGQPLFVYLNSMVILGKEPVIVDPGTPANRNQLLSP